MELNFGQFPRSLLDRGDPQFVNSTFSYGVGVWLEAGLSGLSKLETWFETFDDENEKRDFINSLRNMMRIDPKERSSAAELLREPWM